ncbi:MAG: hypothetical protein B7Z55_09270 [Planctomycetales bacterium 12-60-4]|nr:MAG: hypothetical protein B7Z55_09270 [Planctomycetales bacterium 12-60-4]
MPASRRPRAQALSCRHDPQNIPAPPAVTIVTCIRRSNPWRGTGAERGRKPRGHCIRMSRPRSSIGQILNYTHERSPDMNCENCAAPLDWTSGTDVLKCRFCGSYQALATLADSVDRVSSLQTAAEQACPACQSRLENVIIERMPAASCPDCRGLLLSNAVFAAVIRGRRAAFRGAERTPGPLQPEKLAGRIACPECGRSMDRHPFGGPGSQVIDCCSKCELVWLDCGELAAIEAAPGRR